MSLIIAGMRKLILCLMIVSVLLVLPASVTGRTSLSFQNGKYTLDIDGLPVSDTTETEKLLSCRTIKFENGLSLVFYNIFNGDILYFARFCPEKRSDAILKITVRDDGPPAGVRYLSYKESPDIETNYWVKTTLGQGPLPRATLYIDGLLLSLVDVFKATANETLKENYSLSPPIYLKKNRDGLEYTVILPGFKGKMISHWGVMSSSPLVDWEFEAGNRQVRLADLNRARKLLPWGLMERVSSSYIPGERDNFWWNPSQVVGEAFLRHDETKNRLFTDIATVVLYQLIGKQNTEGYWYSTPASTWLMKDYGIGSNYFDTRFCTDAGMYLLEAYEKYGETKSLQTAVKYGDYLIKHIGRGQKTASGVLSPDYWCYPEPAAAPHTSLNHQVAEMNFLYRLYLNTSDPRFEDSAVLLKNGVRDTGMNWVNPDGDLWYCVTSGGKYEKPDYKVLTLFDLNKANKYILKVEGKKDDTIEKLWLVKLNYARKNKYINW